MVNLLLTLVTLGDDHFWGKTRVPRWPLGGCEVEAIALRGTALTASYCGASSSRSCFSGRRWSG